MKPISPTYLIGKTIESFTYERNKYRLIFNLTNGLEISIYFDKKYEPHNFLTKNRRYTCIKSPSLKNVTVKYVAWCAHYSSTVDSFLIVDTEANVYRMPVSKTNYGPILCLYSHTRYKEKKEKNKLKREQKKATVKNFFSRKGNGYDVVE